MKPSIAFVMIASCLLLAAAPALVAQNPAGPIGPSPTGPIPQNLEGMIATALKSSPEVLLAEAKVRQAQAELNQARLKVTREVVGAFNERKSKQTALESAATQYQQAKQQAGAGAVSKAEVDHARGYVAAAELAMAQSDADIRYLLGIGSQIDPIVSQPAPPPKAKPAMTRPQASDELAEALKRPVTGTFTTTLTELATRIANQAKVSVVIDAQNLSEPNETKIDLALREPVALGGLLEALSDQIRLCFVLREYGIFITTEDRARSMLAASIPANLPLDEEAR